jgi:MoxR-like ATPase
VFVDDRVKDYIISLVFATREPASFGIKGLDGMLRYGASPRATIALTLAAKARAFLAGRGYVTPHDVKSVAPDVLRHRILISYEAEAEDMTSETIIGKLLHHLPVP